MFAFCIDSRIKVHRLPDRAFAGRARGGVRRFVYSSIARGLGQALRLFSTLHDDYVGRAHPIAGYQPAGAIGLALIGF